MERKRREENVSRVWKDEEEEEKVNLVFFLMRGMIGNSTRTQKYTHILAHAENVFI